MASHQPQAPRSGRPLPGFFTGLVLGGLGGFLLARNGHMAPDRKPPRIPMPHLVPQIQSGTALQFVMVHDVLHQRFVKHSRSYYEQRNKDALQRIEQLKKQKEEGGLTHLNLLDDYAVGLERLGRPAAAADVMRDKLELQKDARQAWDARPKRAPRPQLTEAELALYRTYANLGTFLIHAAFPKAREGEASAREAIREGLKHLRRAVEINPGAHFGRETWQIVAAEFLLKVCDDPDLLLKFDMVGNRLDANVSGDGSPYRDGWTQHWQELTADAPDLLFRLRTGWQAEAQRRDIRSTWITRVGAEQGWNKAVGGAHTQPAPFDEPVLGFLGMWTMGGGANPHFALAIGGIMERVGKPRLAWAAYQRTQLLSGRFWPDRRIRDGLTAHCKRRQQAIVAMLSRQEGNTQQALTSDLLERFQAELKHGEELQAALARYEEQEIAQGRHPGFGKVRRQQFYRRFYNSQGRIASQPDGQDWIVTGEAPSRWTDVIPATVLYAGLGALLGVLLCRKQRPREADSVR